MKTHYGWTFRRTSTRCIPGRERAPPLPFLQGAHQWRLIIQSAWYGQCILAQAQDPLFVADRFTRCSFCFAPSGSSLRYLTCRASSKFHSSAMRRFSRNFWMAYLTVRGDNPVSVIISLFVKALPALSSESTIHEEGGSFIFSSPRNKPFYGTCGIP